MFTSTKKVPRQVLNQGHNEFTQVRHPCVVVSELLTTLLGIYDTYTKDHSTHELLTQLTEATHTTGYHINDNLAVTGRELESIRYSYQFGVFLGSVDELAYVDMDRIATNKHAKLSFFLNVYHLLLLHSAAEQGKDLIKQSRGLIPPLSFYKAHSYRINQLGAVNCLSLEHCYLRAQTFQPHMRGISLFLPSIIAESDARHVYTLRPEPLVTFAICNGAQSSARIVVYPWRDQEALTHKLRTTVKLFFSLHLKLEAKTNTILLPKIMEWYQRDFVSSARRLSMPHLNMSNRSINVSTKNYSIVPLRAASPLVGQRSLGAVDSAATTTEAAALAFNSQATTGSSGVAEGKDSNLSNAHSNAARDSSARLADACLNWVLQAGESVLTAAQNRDLRNLVKESNYSVRFDTFTWSHFYYFPIIFDDDEERKRKAAKAKKNGLKRNIQQLFDFATQDDDHLTTERVTGMTVPLPYAVYSAAAIAVLWCAAGWDSFQSECGLFYASCPTQSVQLLIPCVLLGLVFLYYSEPVISTVDPNDRRRTSSNVADMSTVARIQSPGRKTQSSIEAGMGKQQPSSLTAAATEDQIPTLPALETYRAIFTDKLRAAEDTGPPFLPNRRMTIDNALISGAVYFYMRCDQDAEKPFVKEWMEKYPKRQFMINFEGKFKRQNRGPVMMGLELAGALKSLGFMKKQLVGLVLKVVKSMSNDLHANLGDQKDGQLPHVMFPLTQMVDIAIKTAPGQTPPQLETIHESKAQALPRAEAPYMLQYDTESTYSFSFFSDQLDFAHWNVVNIPGMSALSFSSLFENYGVGLVAYELTTDNHTDAAKAVHTQDNSEYLFRFVVDQRPAT